MTDGFFEAPKRRVDRVFLHCSASEVNLTGPALVDEIRRWHLARQFSDVGYHFIVDKEGAVLPGRSLEKTPAAQKGHNTGTIAVCTHGLIFADTWTHSAQAAAIINLCGQINSAYHGVIAFHGHNEVSNKSCPVFSVPDLLGLDRWSRMQ